MNKPYAESCDQNKDPILKIIKPLLQDKSTVLEIGSGTGQHAIYFSGQMPHLMWQPSDQKQNLEGINLWRDESGSKNVLPPVALDVAQDNWPAELYDVVFSANTLHIMHWEMVTSLFSGIKKVLRQGSLLIIYGPFNYNYQYTSESNERFDGWLKQRDPGSGIRHFEKVNELAIKQNLLLINDYAMPENNRILCWRMD